jgi:hypothetical protein
MSIRGAITLCVACGAISALTACSATGRTENQAALTRIAPPATPPNVAVEQNASADHPIRSVDFADFTYSWLPDLGDPKKGFTLQGGKLAETRDAKGGVDEMGVSLESIAYGDVTGDGVEEAIVILSMITGGSSIPHAIYIFTLQSGKPKLLWAFSTGDRAGGGLRRVYAENSELVIERYSPVESKGDCCPTQFTRARYRWQGNHFQQEGKEETLPNPEGHSSPVTEAYHSPS